LRVRLSRGRVRDLVDLVGLAAPVIGSLCLAIGTGMQLGVTQGLALIGVAFALVSALLATWFTHRASARPSRLLGILVTGALIATAVFLLWR
jgi:hypothetical protein